MPPDQITMPAVPPSISSQYPVMQRIDPSPEVQQQVASAIEACTKWQPRMVQVAQADAMPAQASTTAQVCEVLDRWPLRYNGEQLQAVSVGVGLAIATAVACMATWAVFRGALGVLPLAPLARRFIARAVGGAVCGVGLATLSLLLGLPGFAAATLDEAAGKALLSCKGTVPWAAAVLAVLFMLSEIPSVWRRRTSRVATR